MSVKSGESVLQKEYDCVCVNDIREELPTNVLKVLKTMKKSEEVECIIQRETFEKYEEHEETVSTIKELEVNDQPFILEVYSS